MIITLSGGSYSDYWEHWYTCEEEMTHELLGQRLLQHAPEATKRQAQGRQDRWDECEALFGMRTWPFNRGIIGKTGTIEQYMAWRDKWDAILDYERNIMALCGCTRIRPDMEVDIGDYHFGIEDDIDNIARELQKKEEPS